MDEVVVFRKSRWGLLRRAFLLVVLAVWFLWFFESTGRGIRHADPQLLAFMVVVLVLFTLFLVEESRCRLALTPEGLELRGLLTRQRGSWDDVVRVEVPWGGFAQPPLTLTFARARDRGVKGLLGRRIVLGNGWENQEGMVAEVLGRVSGDAIGPRLRRFLAAASHVPLAHRLLLLALLGAAVGAAGYAVVDALAEGSVGLVQCVVAASAAFLASAVGGSIGREKPFKETLVEFYGLLGGAVAAFYLPMFLRGHSPAILLGLSVLVGYGVVVWVLCLPIRVRASRAAALVGIGALSAALPTWWLGIKEPVPACRSGVFMPLDERPAWSPDAAKVTVITKGHERGEKRCLVFDAERGESTWFDLDDIPSHLAFLPDGRVLYHSMRFCRVEGVIDAVSELWVWDGRGRRRIPAPPRLRVASEGFVAEDGSLAVMLAQDHRGEKWELAFLDLASEELRRPGDGVDLSRFRKVRWAADGSLVFTEFHERNEDHDATLSLATMAPGAAGPRTIYRVEAPDVWLRFSPDVRWALVALKNARGLITGYELVDVVERRSEPLKLLGRPALHTVSWSSDGKALAYATYLEGDQTLVVAYPADRRVRRAYVERGGRVRRVALSAGGRFAACTVRGRRSFFIRVVETLTGKTTTLRHWVPYLPVAPPSWSPTGQRLALTHYENLLPGRASNRLYVYEFSAGW